MLLRFRFELMSWRANGVLLALVALAIACSVEGNDPKVDPTRPAEVAASDFDWDGIATRSHLDRPTRLRFPVPATGYRVTATHFAPTSAPIKMKHQIALADGRRDVVRIEIWENSEGLDLNEWFSKYLGFMATADAVITPSRATATQVAAISVRHPGSEQSRPREHMIVALGSRVLRISVLDADDRRSKAIFTRIARELVQEGAL
jgi:hypothetical protein